MSYKLGILKDFAKFARKRLCRSFILIKLQAERFLKIYQKTLIEESYFWQSCWLKISQNSQKIYLYRSLIFNEVVGWKISQNSQENTCAPVSFLMKLQAKGTSSTSNHYYTRIFGTLIRKPSFLHQLHNVLLLITRKSSSCLNSSKIISNVRSCSDGLPRNSSKSNEKRIFAKSCPGKWILFLSLRLE